MNCNGCAFNLIRTRSFGTVCIYRRLFLSTQTVAMGLCIQYKTITDIRRKKTKNRIMSHVTCFSENYTVLVQKTKQNKAAANAC